MIKAWLYLSVLLINALLASLLLASIKYLILGQGTPIIGVLMPYTEPDTIPCSIKPAPVSPKSKPYKPPAPIKLKEPKNAHYR